MSPRYPAYTPLFGNGAPGVKVTRTLPYWDTSTNPYTLYMYEAGAWHACGAVPPIDATDIQGVAVSATAPTVDGQALTYVGANNDWEPV